MPSDSGQRLPLSVQRKTWESEPERVQTTGLLPPATPESNVLPHTPPKEVIARGSWPSPMGGQEPAEMLAMAPFHEQQQQQQQQQQQGQLGQPQPHDANTLQLSCNNSEKGSDRVQEVPAAEQGQAEQDQGLLPSPAAREATVKTAAFGASTLGASSRSRMPADDGGVFTLDDTAVEALRAAHADMDLHGTGMVDSGMAAALLQKVFGDEADDQQVRRLVQRIFGEAGIDSSDCISFDDFLLYLDPRYHMNQLGDDEWEMFQLVADNGIALGPPPTWRETLWAVMNVEDAMRYLTEGDWLRKLAVLVQSVSQLAILTSIVNMMVESEPNVNLIANEKGHDAPTFIVEAVTIALFTLELLLRIISTPSQRTFWSGVYTWIDLLSIFPFYLSLSGVVDDRARGLAVLRIVRLTRLLRILKVGRHSVGIHLMVLSVRKALLPLLWLWFVLVLAMILFAALVYQAETMFAAEINEEKVKWVRSSNSGLDDAGQVIDIQSIHSAMWWAVVTLTTTGYGDAVPATALGKVVGALTMMCGVILLAFPTTILTQQFTRVFEAYEMSRAQQERKQKVRQKLLNDHFRKRERTSSDEKVDRADKESSEGVPVKETESAVPTRGTSELVGQSLAVQSALADDDRPFTEPSSGVGSTPMQPPTHPPMAPASECEPLVSLSGVTPAPNPLHRLRRRSVSGSRTTAVTQAQSAASRAHESGQRDSVTSLRQFARTGSTSSTFSPSGARESVGGGSVRSLTSLLRLRDSVQQHQPPQPPPPPPPPTPQPNGVLSPSQQRAGSPGPRGGWTPGRRAEGSVAALQEDTTGGVSPVSSLAGPRGGTPVSRTRPGATVQQTRLRASQSAGGLQFNHRPQDAPTPEQALREQLRELRCMQREMAVDQQRELAQIRDGVAQAVELLRRLEAIMQARHSQPLQLTPT
eukprot:TRINITY_DN8594_c0_g2_i1.p1 TRINITY_DN8594_c0_g2~~TRINITY_DN8594_c0_g2_i1.p1  ORF type:complete len:925 (+),score=367.52 TRINITY_DN8594_c0_g2_i1:204-2978(+)